MVDTFVQHKEKWLINFSRIGIASKGVVYCILGLITLMVSLGRRDDDTGKDEVFKTILEQPFGKILLLILTVGLSGYVVWRIIQAIKDPYHKGNDLKGVVARVGYVWSAVIYTGIIIYAGSMALNGGSAGKGGDSNKMIVSKILEQPFGQYLVGAIAVGIMIFGVYQIYRAIKGTFMKHMHISGKGQNIYRKAGSIGYTARGIVFMVIGFLFLKAALHSNPSEAKGTEGAFDFINSSFGPWILGFIACGFIAYGIFMFVKVKYAEMHM